MSVAEQFSDYTLQWRIVYSVLVANKSAKFADTVMERLFVVIGEMPFEVIEKIIGEARLSAWLRAAHTGRYRVLTKTFPALLNINLRTCGVQTLELVPGIGPKTARFFLLWTRPDIEVAALDRHILKWLRKQGVDAPIGTPQPGKTYQRLERIFIEEARKRKISVRDLDYAVWSMYAYNL